MKPILFSTPMVQAILAGHKTMTRRVVKPQPTWVKQDAKYRVMPDCWWWCGIPRPDVKNDIVSYAPHKPGDILYVRETFYHEYGSVSVAGIEYTLHDRYCYKADFKDEIQPPWRPSIHMPKKAARIFLRVTDVRVERVQEITREDAIAEGMVYLDTPRVDFAQLWDSLNDKRGFGWETNPWVWVYTFERCEKGA